MKKVKYLISSSALYALPFAAAAQITSTTGGGGQFEITLRNIMTFINSTLIPFIIAVGFLAFVWGMFQYFIAGGSNEESKEKGKSLMIWATVGFVMIIIFWGLINLIAGSIGLEDATIKPPVVPTPNP